MGIGFGGDISGCGIGNVVGGGFFLFFTPSRTATFVEFYFFLPSFPILLPPVPHPTKPPPAITWEGHLLFGSIECEGYEGGYNGELVCLDQGRNGW